MSLTVYPTADYDSWISIADAITYFEGRLHADEWKEYDDVLQEQALRTGFRSLQELNTDLTDLDSETQADVDALLQALQWAQCEQALWELKQDLDESNIKSVSLGGLLAMSMQNTEDDKPDRFSSRTLALLKPYLTLNVISRKR